MRNFQQTSQAERTRYFARSATRGEKKNKNNGLRTGALFFSSPPHALRAKYRVRPAWLIKRLSCRLDSGRQNDEKMSRKTGKSRATLFRPPAVQLRNCP